MDSSQFKRIAELLLEQSLEVIYQPLNFTETVVKIPRVAATVNRGFFSAEKRRGYMKTVVGKKKEFYSSYIAKILTQVHQDFSGYNWALDILWSLDKWLFEQAILEAVRLSFFNHRQVVTIREVIEALKQVLPEGWT